MRLTPIHARYWSARKGPAWARLASEPRPTIDACINAHAEPDTRRPMPHQLARPRARVEAILQRLASEPAHGGRLSRSAADARKWLARIRLAELTSWWIGRPGLTGEALAAYDLTPRPRYHYRQMPVRTLQLGPELTDPGAVAQVMAKMEEVSRYEISPYEIVKISPRGGTVTARLDLARRSEDFRTSLAHLAAQSGGWPTPRG